MNLPDAASGEVPFLSDTVPHRNKSLKPGVAAPGNCDHKNSINPDNSICVLSLSDFSFFHSLIGREMR